MKKNLVHILSLSLALALAGASVSTISGEGRVNINTAGSEELQTLEGVGPRVAMKFIAERQANGPYHSLEDLQQRVLGVDDRMLDSLRRQGLYAGPPVGS